MRLSKLGAGQCLAHEAIYLYAYPDPGTGGEPITIGGGHTSRAGPPAVRMGQRISLQRALEIYLQDMSKFETGVSNAIRVPLKQHEFDAAVSLHFNTGAIKTGSIDDKLNRGDRAGALATWAQYNKAGGRVMQGLVNRRRDEINLFRTGVYPSRTILLRETSTSTPRRINAANVPWPDAATLPAVPVAPPAAPVVIAIDRPLPAKQPKPAAAGDFLSAIGRWLGF